MCRTVANPEFSGELEPQWKISDIVFGSRLSLHVSPYIVHFELRMVLTLAEMHTEYHVYLQITEIFKNMIEYVVIGVSVAVTHKLHIQYCLSHR